MPNIIKCQLYSMFCMSALGWVLMMLSMIRLAGAAEKELELGSLHM